MPLAALLSGLVIVASQPAAADSSWQAACVDHERQVVTTTIATGDQGAPDRLEAPDFSHCWVWNDSCAPRKVLHGEVLPVGCSDRTARIAAHQEGERLAAHIRLAPLAMWAEVPESLLPAVATDAKGRADVVVGEGPWQARARHGLSASGWQVITGEERRVELELQPARSLAWRVEAEGKPHPRARSYLVTPPESPASSVRLQALEQTSDKGEIRFLVPVGARSTLPCR